MGDLSAHFNKREFACRDNCGFDAISMDLIYKLEAVHQRLDKVLIIDDGCRCPTHNAAVGGKADSAHLRGMAADIYCADSSLRFELVNAALAEGFKRIEVGSNWVHLDIDDSLPQRVMFLPGTGRG